MIFVYILVFVDLYIMVNDLICFVVIFYREMDFKIDMMVFVIIMNRIV